MRSILRVLDLAIFEYRGLALSCVRKAHVVFFFIYVFRKTTTVISLALSIFSVVFLVLSGRYGFREMYIAKRECF